ncbi:MAG: hypothetical protein ACR2PA_11955 [Hyphomicrobiaceae bacterium]
MTRRTFSAQETIRIVLEGLRGEATIAGNQAFEKKKNPASVSSFQDALTER